MPAPSSYGVNVLLGVDLALNAALGGLPYETLSGRAWRMHLKGQRFWGWTYRFIDRLHWFGIGHCRRAYEAEKSARPSLYSLN